MNIPRLDMNSGEFPDRSGRPSRPSTARTSGNEAEKASPQAVAQAADQMAAQLNLKVEVVQDVSTGNKVVRIFDKDGSHLLRQMPPEAVLEIMRRLQAGGGSLLASVV